MAQNILSSLAPQNNNEINVQSQKNKRGLLDGCFDLVHAGHLNAIRQGHAICGDNLVVAVLSDKAIEAAKGPTVLKIDERL